jgi:histidinol-phosphate aminotransferase
VTVRPRSGIEDLAAYEPVEAEGLNLSDNANLFETNPAIQQALEEVSPDEVRTYPSGYSDELRERVAEVHDHPAEGVVTANGSSDLIDLLVRTFTDPGDPVAFHPPSFSMIPLWTSCNACEPEPVPLGEQFGLDVDAFAGAEANVGFVCRPNNPTGNAFPIEQVERLADDFEGLLVVDEAYVNFADVPDATHLLDREDVAVLRSLSKDAGLAGTRFGYGLFHPDVAREIRKVRGPFRVPRVTEEIAKRALADRSHVDRVAKTVATERQRVRSELQEMGLSPFPSQTNFVLVETPWPSTRVQQALAAEGVLVREFSSDTLEACFRATIGPPDVNDQFLDAVQAMLDEGGP